MTAITWPFVEAAAHLLERDEREAVLGDLAESGESAWQMLLQVLGLGIRRQALFWKSWRPWLAALGLACPSSFLLMGFSFSISSMYLQSIGPNISRGTLLSAGSPVWLLVGQFLLLLGCSWTAGFTVGSLSKRTLWASIVASCLPCLFCLVRFHVQSLSRFCLFLFLLPAIWGAHHGLRRSRIQFGPAIVLALAITAWMALSWSSGSWILYLALIWPAWYIVATAQEAGGKVGRSGNGR